MAKIYIAQGTKFMLKGENFVIRAVMDRQVSLDNMFSGEKRIVSMDELLNTWSKGELHFLVAGKSPTQTNGTNDNTTGR